MFRLSHCFLASKTLVVAELSRVGGLTPATLSAITAAKSLGGPITALVAGSRAKVEKAASELSTIAGITAVLQSEGDHLDGLRPDEVAPLVHQVVQSHAMTHVIAGCSSFGKDVIPLAAARHPVMPITDVLEVKGEDTFVRPMYAGNVIATIQSKNPVHYITVRTTSFDRAEVGGQPACPVEPVTPPPALNHTKIISESSESSDTPDLTTAPIVIAGGRGLKTKENFDKLYPLAKKLNAAVGATRAAVDAGFTANEFQIGQTGKNVAPELYIAVGISGAIQHVAGMRDSKVVVAVNTDEEAPIFQSSDFAVVADATKFVEELTEKFS